MDTTATLPLLAQLASLLLERGWRLVTAESCTGGLIAAACTELAGSSNWFECGHVTYGNAAKTAMLGVPPELLAAHGAVSEPVARAMAEGALAHCSTADLAVAVTGIAGPGGATPGKPVGTVWLAWAQRGGATRAFCQHFEGDRAQVREATCRAALQGLIDALAGAPQTAAETPAAAPNR